MTNYNNGKIYKIESPLGDMVYYGSTTKQYLSQRMTKHRTDYNKWLSGKDTRKYSSFDLFDAYAIENCKIILVENYPCESKDELRAQEAHYIKNFECVNKNIPGRTRKQWCEDNKDKMLEKSKQYYQDNKDKIRQYREDNKDKILEYQSKYYENNKETRLEKMKIKHTCICGSCIRKDKKSRHERSIKHIKFLESQ